MFIPSVIPKKYAFGRQGPLATLTALRLFAVALGLAIPAFGTSKITQLGEDFSVYQSVISRTNLAGDISYQTNSFTLIENCLNYQENGNWKESEDVIEPFPGGAVAQRGPHKAIFSPDLNSEAVFDVLTSDAKRLKGGVRSILVTDSATGQSSVLASVKKQVQGEIMPPNFIVYPDGFDGLRADVVYVWKHNLFAQEVVLRERPALPRGMNQKTAMLEIVTEFVNAPVPDLRKQNVQMNELTKVTDHTVIDFGKMAIVMGKAFEIGEKDSVKLGSLTSDDRAVAVAKQWHTLQDGRTFLVESVAWERVQDYFDALLGDEALIEPKKDSEIAARAGMANPSNRSRGEKSIKVALAHYKPEGYVVDFTILPGASITTFTAGTYYIKTSFYSGSTVTFDPGCIIKYKNNANMILYGAINFPDTLQTPVFTSRNDDSFGPRQQNLWVESGSGNFPRL